MATISDKKMKVNEQDSEDILMISKIKKGVAWEGGGHCHQDLLIY